MRMNNSRNYTDPKELVRIPRRSQFDIYWWIVSITNPPAKALTVCLAIVTAASH